MSVTESQIKQSISQSIKQQMIDNKYPDEPISFGQAVVTQFFLTH